MNANVWNAAVGQANAVREAPKVAIVGMAAMFPGEGGTTGFWRTITRGEDTIGDVPENYWRIEDYYDPDPATPDKTYCKRGGFLKHVPFDTLRFGVPPSVMKATDTAQLLALLAASEVLESVSKSQRTPVDRSRTGVVLGVASATELCVHLGGRLQRPVWANALREHGMPEDEIAAICERISDHYVPWQEASFPSLLGNVVAGRIANRLDLGGANFVTDAACASSLSALQVALSQLYLGEADLVMAGGVDALNDILMFMCFSKTPAFSLSGDCRPFSDQADGTILGEGVGMFALRRLEDAERDGNDIYAVIRGIGAASDGKATSVYAPRPEGQALAIERAYAAAGYSPKTVGMIEAHGTGTKAGDAAEFAGLCRVFGADEPERRQWCALGSVKSQVGHAKAAAGSAGLFKAAMALHHKVMPPTLKVERPNPNLKIEESPFFLNTELRPWIQGSAHPRRAAVSSFGFGGSNFHVALEEYTGAAKRAPKRRHHDCELVLASAPTPAGLDAALAGVLDRAAKADLSLVAFETQVRFDPRHACRVSLPAANAAQLADMVAKARRLIAEGVREAPVPGGGRIELAPAGAGKVAILFPGQGSQYVGMGGGLAVAFDAARRVWDRAADDVRVDGSALHDVVFPPPAFTDEARAAQDQRLTRMAFAQPAIGATAASALAMLHALGVRGDAFAGHSFGEVMALHAGGAFDLDTALAIAAERGRLMTVAAKDTEGAMLAVAAGRAAVSQLVAELRLDVVVANDNGPQQVVLSGTKAAIAAAKAALQGRGLNVTQLPVATGFHSPIVAGSCQPFRQFLAGRAVGVPVRPVYANTTSAPYPADRNAAADLLAAQLGQPVRFRETVERMYADGVRTFIEVGPGSVLTGLVRSCLGDRPHRAIALDRKSAKGLAAFWQGVGEMALAGLPLNLQALWDEFPAEPETIRPAGAHVFDICGVNVGKPYPRKDGTPVSKAPPRQVAAPVVAAPAVVAPAPVVAVEMPSPAPAASLLASFQERLDEHQKRLEGSLIDAHRAYLDASQAALLAALGQVSAPIPAARPVPAPVAMPAVEMPVIAVETQKIQAFAADLPAPSAPDDTVLRLVEAVVAEKTGYPAEVLGHDMDLEAELGIDSIKQVEILSALRERMPGLPELEPAALAKFRTIAMIARMLEGNTATPAVAEAPAVAMPVVEIPVEVPASAAPAPVQNDTVLRLVEAVVAEKTGYPAEVLGHDMDLEAELGIDSIKQVEILSALRERMPGLPELEPAALAKFRTIAMIARMLEGNTATPAVAEAPAVAMPVVEIPVEVPASAAPAPVQNDTVLRLVEAVVAEKTGYPAEVLGHDMDLEAELGIDSIKQVEILSALRERMPGLPELEPAALAKFRTIAMIARMLEGNTATPAVAEAPAVAMPVVEIPVEVPASAASAPVQNDTVLRLVEAVVAEKTGYPAEVLGHDMDLEAELGIDSIKQVEILSALRERMPGLPELEPAALAKFRTIAMIARMLEGDVPPPPPPAAGAPRPAAPAPAAAVAVPVRIATNPLTRHEHALVESAPAGFMLSALARAEAAVILGGPADLAAALGRRLAARGLQVAAAIPADASRTAVVLLHALDGEASPERALDLHRSVFLAAKAFSAAGGAKGGAFITIQDTGGDFGHGGATGQAAALAGLTGLVKTAAREWPGADVKAIDVACAGRTADAIAALIADEILAGGPEIEVGFDEAGRRLVPVACARPLDRLAGLPLADGDVLVVSGGARGVTAAAAIALAGQARLRIALLGRTPLVAEAADLAGAVDEVAIRQRLVGRATAAGRRPDIQAMRRETAQTLAGREIASTLAAIRAAGSDVRYAACDVTDAASVAHAVGEVRRAFGPVAGLIHGAGVIADKAIADKPVADFDTVFRTKVAGWANLLAAIGNDPLKLVCNFSSVSAKFGNVGQSDYAMANEVLNKLAIAYARSHPACRVKSICWGPWAGGMVDASLKRHFENAGVGLIDLAAGADALIEELSSADGSVEVVLREGDFLPPVAIRATVDLDGTRHAFLADHRVNGEVVLPVVLVQEWFARAALAGVHGGAVAIENLQVLKGVVSSGFPAKGYRLDVDLVPAGGVGTYEAKLLDADGLTRYAARVIVDGGALDAAPIAAAAAPAAVPGPAPVYGDGRIFHGPAFQTIREVGAFTASGGSALIGSTVDRGWRERTFATDPAAIDGALQLALVWVGEQTGNLCLPIRIAACRILRRAAAGEVYACTMRSRKVDRWRSVHDFELTLGDDPAIILTGVEMYMTRIEIGAPSLALA